ncbi:MAG: ABC transporter permease, partial [Lachnospiraceae bacterium]|nr:ABC transporter permease [Lachnospiraceae bacterium]
QFYLASGIVLFLMLAGMALYPVVQREPSAFCRQLGRQGAGQGWQCFCQWMCGFLCTAALACLLFGAIGVALRYVLPRTVAAQLTAGRAVGAAVGVGLGNGALIVAAVSTFVYLLLSLAGSRASGIMLVFVFTVGLMYLSGGLVPAVFLPEAVRTVGERLPAACLIQAAGGILTGQSVWRMGQCPVLLCSYTLLSGAAAVLVRCRQYRG